MTERLPLGGVRVLELGLWVAAPAAGGILADWGADVVKIEPLGGEPMRHVLKLTEGRAVHRTPLFDRDTRGKRSIELDLRHERGRDLLQHLLTEIDVFVTNLRPGALDRLGLDAATVLERHPRLVYAAVSGYGLAGPDRDRAGYDVGAFWARSGAAGMIVPPGEEPPSSPTAFGDHLTGVTIVAGIMGALFDRERTGRGQLVSTSLLRTGVYAVSADLALQAYYGRRSETRRRDEVGNPLLNRYRAADGRWFFLIGIESDRHWPPLARAIGRSELIDDDRFRDARSRRHHAGELVALLDEAFATRDRSKWAARFDDEGVWWSPVNSAEDILADPQAVAAGAFVDVPDGDGTEYRSVATPVDFSSGRAGPQGPVPAAGEHTAAILSEIGVGSEELAKLRDEGVVGHE
jgi:crotonobetainyl-CoA:carnitine CoA-transferase CaiB-like acyl-CoA transferase